MTITLELKPEVEAKLLAEAERQGKPLPIYPLSHGPSHRSSSLRGWQLGTSRELQAPKNIRIAATRPARRAPAAIDRLTIL